MTAGIQVWGDHGYRQIDDTYANLAFMVKLTATMGAASGQGSFCSVQYNGRNPVIAIRAGFPLALLGGSFDGVTYTWTFGTNANAAGASFDVYVFDSATSSGNFGLQVFKDDGSVAFDSNLKYMRVMAAVSPPANTPGYGSNWEYNGLPAGTYAVAFSSCRTGVYSIPFTDVIYVADQVYITPAGAGIRLQGYGNKGIWDQGDGNGLQIETSVTSQLVIVDVSGY